jgi:CDGSH-type Zn-finger protein
VPQDAVDRATAPVPPTPAEPDEPTLADEATRSDEAARSDEATAEPAEEPQPAPGISIMRGGPYVVEGSVPLTRVSIESNEQGESWEWREEGWVQLDGAYRLCRCGAAGTPPFCDDTCTRDGFDGTERAKRVPYLDQAEEFEGPRRDLTDAPSFCSSARFCDAKGSIWALVERNSTQAEQLVDREAVRCPSGRLVAWVGRDALEPEHRPSIALTEDPARGVSGPIWVRGGIPIRSADGFTYEVRNRVTLCRCGASRNKPFCDGSHIRVRFSERSTG